MLAKLCETHKGIVYLESIPINNGTTQYKGWLSLKLPTTGAFAIQRKVFPNLLACAEHVEQLKEDLLNYDNNPRSYIRLFV